jgi:hypothetical protein
MTEQKFDVFLCHSTEDKPAVIQIAKQLQQKSLKPWLDVWALRPGLDWQDALEQQIEGIGAAAVFVGSSGLGPWQSQEIKAFLRVFSRRPGCPIILVLLPNAPKEPQIPLFLGSRHWVDFRRQDPDPLAQLLWGITGVMPSARLDTAQAIDAQTAATVGWAPPTTPPVAPTPAPKDDLSSEKGTDYSKLRDLLKAGQWREADEETYETMIRAVGKEPGKWFTKEELLNFPCTDLLTIDRLWVTYSNGKFGFSVQKNIWQECGSPTGSGKNWDKFCVRVGWQGAKAARYTGYDKLTADPQSSPEGEFPGWRLGGFWGWLGVLLSSAGGSWPSWFFVRLFPRIETCKL